MSTVVRMPEVLAGTTEAAIQTWLVMVGQTLTVGMPIAEVETEKANVEYASEVEGTVLKLVVAEGENVPVGAAILLVGNPGESVDDKDLHDQPSATRDPVREKIDSPVASDAEKGEDREMVTSAAGASVDSARSFASPLVRRLAREQSLDLSRVVGSGPGGRIVRRDLDALAELVQPEAASSEPSTSVGVLTGSGPAEVPHTGMRKAIARRLTESKSTVPHFYLVADCRVERLIALRREINESATVKISVNDFVLKASAMALIAVPEANATWGESSVTRYSNVDMSVAVAIDGGLVTPVLRSVEQKTLTQIAREVADMAERAKAGRLKQHELEGGSFAVSNLGMYGVSEFTAIINPPQSAILAVGAAQMKPVADEGELRVGSVMTVTLSADHRVLDGSLAAQWLAAFVRYIENPLLMLA